MNKESSQRPPVVKAEESGVIQALEPRDLSIVAPIGKYRFLGVLGHGGMADVYLAMADGPEGFRKLCVVKMLKDSMATDEDFRAMFVDEARLAARLTHPNIVQTYEVEAVGGRLLLAMEYVEGATLARVRRRMAEDAFPIEAAVRVLCDVLEALNYAHSLTDFDGESLEIVHRDVSPHNIIIGYSGNVKLLDFGIAKSAASNQATQAGVLKGKVGYMAPEQASFANVDARADLFSVGVILWEAIAGRRLADGNASSHAVLMRRVEGHEPRIEDVVPDVDPALAEIVGRALSTEPDARYATAAEFLHDLERWLSTRTEMPRRMWANHIAGAFEEDRRRLQALANLRASDHSLNIRAAMPTIPAEPSAPPPPVLPSTTPAMPVAALSAAPPAKSRTPLLVLSLVGVALVVGVIVFALSSSSTKPPPITSATPIPSAAPTIASAPAIEPSALPSLPSTAIATSTPEPGSAAAPVVTHGGGPIRRPGPVFTPPPPPPPPVRSAKPTSTTNETPRPTATGARPLDERDPYAP